MGFKYNLFNTRGNFYIKIKNSMKKIIVIALYVIFYTQANAQKIAFQKIDCKDYSNYSYLNNSIFNSITNSGLTCVQICNSELQYTYWGYETSNWMAGIDLRGILDKNKLKIAVKNLSDLGYSHLIVPIESKRLFRICTSPEKLNKSNDVWWCKFNIYNLSNLQSKQFQLTISTSGDCNLTLESCSNINNILSEIKDFVQGNGTNLSSNNYVNLQNTVSDQQLNSSAKKKKYFFGGSDNSEGKLKVVRAKERNPSNNQPVSIDVYDKNLGLKVGDNIIITRTDEVNIPGEKKSIKSETTIGKAKITEDFNKPLYTAKLIASAGFNMKDYKDGEENYNAVKGEYNKTIIATPKIMVIPQKIDPSKFVNGEYLLSKDEKMLMSAFKNKFEDNKFTTYGFESNLKTILENRQFNNNVQDDIKSKILESSGMDFFVEYDNLDQNNTKCDKVFDFKIRNYSTGEDIASDVKSLNTCGTPDDYKNFASTILNSGAVSKINTQFSSLLNNGRKVSLIFTISNFSQTNFNKEYNGVKLKDHIENCLQGLAFNGNLDIEGVVDLRMETTVNIPITNENTGKSYTTNTFSEDIISYLKKNASVDCESSVSKQIVNIKIK